MRKLTSKTIAKNRLLIALRKAEDRQNLNSKENKAIKRLLIALGGPLLICTVTSCGFNVSLCQGHGCKAPADLATGIIAETKNPADKKSSYWQNRDLDAEQGTWIENIWRAN